eukprot:gene6084-6787_t
MYHQGGNYFNYDNYAGAAEMNRNMPANWIPPPQNMMPPMHSQLPADSYSFSNPPVMMSEARSFVPVTMPMQWNPAYYKNEGQGNVADTRYTQEAGSDFGRSNQEVDGGNRNARYGGKNEHEYGRDRDKSRYEDTENQEKRERRRDKDDDREKRRNKDRGRIRDSSREDYNSIEERGRWSSDDSDYYQKRDRERERKRTRDRDRDRDKRRDRHGRRDEDRSRDRSKSRDRNRDRSRDRGRDRDRSRDKERDRRRIDRSDRDRDYDEDRSDRRDKDEKDKDRHILGTNVGPSPHVMIRGLASILTKEDEVGFELQQLGLEYKDIKIVKNRQGESRGFAFVDFYDVKTAEKWLELTKGIVTINGHQFPLEYSKAKSPPPLAKHEADWCCSKCRTLNYASRKRTTCFSCGEYRKDFDDDHGDSKEAKESQPSAPPCNVLMMRGLDTNSSEETIRNSIAELTSLPIYDVRLIKDKITGMSRGFCFIEFGSTEDATSIMKKIQDSDPAYFIDGRRVSVGYAKNTPYPPPSKSKQGGDGSSGARQQSSTAPAHSSIASIAIAQAQAAQLQGQADYGFQQQQQHAYQSQLTHSINVMKLTINPLVPGWNCLSISRIALQQYSQGVPASQQATDSTPEQTQKTNKEKSEKQVSNEASQLQPPHSSMQGYTYDAATGYYYDATTGLYYDANTGYYYNSTIGKFLCWDAEKQQYLAVNQDGSFSNIEKDADVTSCASTSTVTASIATTSTAVTPTSSEKVKAKPTGVSARKIAKDMERWAKKTNEAKNAKSKSLKQVQLLQREMEAKEEEMRKRIQDEVLHVVSAHTLIHEAKKAGANSLFAADEDDHTNKTLASLLSTKPGAEKKALASHMVADYGNDSDDESGNESQFIDFQKLACLLCKRQFPNKDILIKHTQLSDLHKQNLALLKQKML